MLCRVGTAKHAVGSDNVHREQVIDREPELAAGPAEATAEGEPGDAGGRVDADRNRKTERLSFLVHVGEQRTTLDAGTVCGWIDVHRAHTREIEHDASVANRITRDVVTAAPHGQSHAVLASEVDPLDHIRGSQCLDDHAGSAIYHAVPDGSRRVVARLPRQQHAAS